MPIGLLLFLLLLVELLSLQSSAFGFGILPRTRSKHTQRATAATVTSAAQGATIGQRFASAIDNHDTHDSIETNNSNAYYYYSPNRNNNDDNNDDNNNDNDDNAMEENCKNDSCLGFSDTTNHVDLVKALEEGTTPNATENVFTVDEHNHPTPTGHPRSRMRLHRLWHRATYIVIRHDYNTSIKDDDDDDDEFLLVQRRTKIKDYCPGKLDPTPGGVVGFGESYLQNATREMMEEMNIDLSEDSGNELKELFVFPYQDDNVKVWGGLFEVTFRKPLDTIQMQPEEVSEVLRLSTTDIRRMALDDPGDWMPDGLHAIRLYLQYKADRSLHRRLLKGYSNGDPRDYKLRPKPAVILFDCDDCLYFDNWQLAAKLTANIEEWCTSKKNLPPGKAYQLYKEHGTALKGLLAEGIIENTDQEIDAYLRDVHQVPVSEHLSVDTELREMILRINPSIPKYIFTASVRHHAERCLEALGIRDLFVDIIDVKSCNLATKHSREAFQAAMAIANVPPSDAESVLFLDDSIKNIQVARSMGIRSFLVGKVGRDSGQAITTEHAEQELDRIHDFPNVVPELFSEEPLL